MIICGTVYSIKRKQNIQISMKSKNKRNIIMIFCKLWLLKINQNSHVLQYHFRVWQSLSTRLAHCKTEIVFNQFQFWKTPLTRKGHTNRKKQFESQSIPTKLNFNNELQHLLWCPWGCVIILNSKSLHMPLSLFTSSRVSSSFKSLRVDVNWCTYMGNFRVIIGSSIVFWVHNPKLFACTLFIGVILFLVLNETCQYTLP